MKPNAKKRSANKSGAVLVTAVVVLLIMSILMTATIGHVAVNRRKTNSNYSRKQAYLTASTTLKSFVAEIQNITSAPSKKDDDAARAKQIANINALKQLAQANEGKGTKKQVREQAQKKRVKSFLNQNLGTVTHKSERDYDRSREKAKLRKEVADSEE